eukprot:TRINITY_DN943_c0_g1_i1.p1 TRINITY_DN943_c0_g1~~TRINITY_DN943_c0_g1_i1.p1  ORF type:complete len:339 (-),score=82.18 TRINITY_DN943_c0_g1_i1:216-1232(-)
MNIQNIKISVIKEQLYIIRLDRKDKETLNSCFRAILYIALFPENCNELSFFSYTKTEDEISLIIDDVTLRQYFPENLLNIDISGPFKAINITEGEDAIDQIGIIRSIATPLIKEDLSVFYFSTYSTDLILVEEEDLDKSINILEKLISNHQTINQEPLFDKQDFNFQEINNDPNTSTMLLQVAKKELVMLRFPYNELQNHCKSLLNLFIGAEDNSIEDLFFSFTRYDDEITILFGAEYIDTLFNDNINKENNNNNNNDSDDGKDSKRYDIWSVIQISQGSTGFSNSSVGVVSNALCDNEISIYFTSTFTYDFVLVPKIHLQNSMDVLVNNFNAEIVQN